LVTDDGAYGKAEPGGCSSTYYSTCPYKNFGVKCKVECKQPYKQCHPQRVIKIAGLKVQGISVIIHFVIAKFN
jgi:hypothetical protein